MSLSDTDNLYLNYSSFKEGCQEFVNKNKNKEATIVPEKKPEQKKYPVHNQSRMYKDLKTEKQWLKLGYVPVEDANGVEMWVNGFRHQRAIYYGLHEVKIPLAADYSRLKSRLQAAEEKLDEIETVIAKSDLPDQTKKKLLYILK